jgi:hypothetical protein
MTGSARLSLAIADVPIAVDLPDPAWAPTLRVRYAAFLVTDPPAWRVTLAHDPTLADTDTPWIHHDGPRTTFRVLAYAGWLDLATRTAQVCTPSATRASSALERTLAYSCMQVLPREHDGLLLHAAGVVWAGQGYAFIGPSGAGKTTVARLAQGHADVLTDENVVVRVASQVTDTSESADHFELLSTPFWGTSTPAGLVRRINRSAPLRAIFTLAHTPEFRLERLAPAAAVLALLATEKVATERPESAAAWLAVAERLITAVPVYRLGFRPTPELWDFLQAAVGRQNAGR